MHSASNDPFVLEEVVIPGAPNNNFGNNGVSGKTLRSSVISSNTLILITAGDSNMASVGPSAFTPTNSTVVDNLNIYDGATYAAADPLLGSTIAALGNGGLSAQIADKFVTAGTFARVIIVPVAVGGTTTTIWAAGGPLYNRLNVAMARLAARGIVPGAANCTFALVYQIGANEAGILSAAYTANVQQTINKVKSAGFSARVFIPTYSMNANTTNSAITTGQANLIDGVTFFAGGNIDSLTGGTNRQGDGTHLTAAGQSSAATLIYNAMHASGAPF